MVQQTTRRGGKPNWCESCGGYRPRTHDCARRSAPAPAAPAAPFDLAQVPYVTSPDYLAGWRAGYAAAMLDRAERTSRP